MTDRPILFQGRLVRAILRGEKTQTRRVGPGAKRWLKAEAGDRLWVRESGWLDRAEGRFFGYAATPEWAKAADTGLFPSGVGPDFKPDPKDWKAVPSIHMPRWASRITLELTEKPRLESLQAMRERDAVAEGVQRNGDYWHGVNHDHKTARDAFECLWDSINEDRGFGWDANPEVVVLTFAPPQGSGAASRFAVVSSA